jgi:tetratricopeptide (TPR) repeat protein
MGNAQPSKKKPNTTTTEIKEMKTEEDKKPAKTLKETARGIFKKKKNPDAPAANPDNTEERRLKGVSFLKLLGTVAEGSTTLPNNTNDNLKSKNFQFKSGTPLIKTKISEKNLNSSHGMLDDIKNGEDNTNNIILPLIHKAIAYRELGDYNEAINVIDKALDMESCNSGIYICKGNTYFEMRNYVKAIDLYDKAIEFDGRNSHAFAKKAECFRVMGNLREAEKYYDTANNLNPNDFYILFNKGNIHFEMKEYQQGLECYNKAIKIDPNKHETYYNKGNTLRYMKKFEDAIEAYDRAIEGDGTRANYYNNKGITLKSLRQYDEAIECFKKANLLDSVNRSTYINLGNTFTEIGKCDEAIKYYDECLKIHPDPEAYNNKAIVLFKLENFQESIECFDYAIALKPHKSRQKNHKQTPVEENDIKHKK